MLTTTPNLPLDIIIVGAGIGGLAAAYTLGRAGHKITVLERAAEISDVGAGIQVAPNLSRLLIRWGLGEELAKRSSKPEGISFLRYSTGERVGWTKWGAEMEAEYGAPYYHIHRADLLSILHSLAAPYIHKLRLNTKVTSISFPASNLNPSVNVDTALADGTSLSSTFSADLVIGADGLHSVVRSLLLASEVKEKETKPIHTGYSAYRSVVPTEQIPKPSECEELIARREMISWMGPEKHVIGYSMRGGKEYNLVLVQRDKLNPNSESGHNRPATRDSYNSQGLLKDMGAEFAGWDPRLQKLLGLVEETSILPLQYREPLDNWVHPSGRVVLLGDAAHPSLPSRAQGAAMAVEDAAVLGILLSFPISLSLQESLHVYQSLRHARTTATHRAAKANFNLFHLPDGLEQTARDASMRAAGGESANMWADKKKSEVQFAHDAEAEAERWLRERSSVSNLKHSWR
ncbi:FAD/NAD-binding domain-containing protein [Mycena amicta]|nr:FAD/NAD-binding domain-containing protein [Mycena amicta]